MKILLDNQIFIWFVENDKKLHTSIKNEIEKNQNHIYISIASIWEIAIKVSLGKLILSQSLENLIKDITQNGFEILPILPTHILTLSKLNFHHRDPFNRIIISQGISDKLTVITSDYFFEKYKVKLLSN